MCRLYIIYQNFKYLQKTPYCLYELQIRTAVLGNRILYFPLSSNTSSQVSAWISHAQLVKNILFLSSWNRFDEHICQLNISWRVYKCFSAFIFSRMKWQSASICIDLSWKKWIWCYMSCSLIVNYHGFWISAVFSFHGRLSLVRLPSWCDKENCTYPYPRNS